MRESVMLARTVMALWQNLGFLVLIREWSELRLKKRYGRLVILSRATGWAQ